MRRGFKVDFLQCSIILKVLFSANSQEECNKDIYDELFPCGNVERYKEITDRGGGLEYKLVGDKICYAVVNHRLSWQQARDHCKQHDGQLAEFPTNELYANFKTKRPDIIDKSDGFVYWLGGWEDPRRDLVFWDSYTEEKILSWSKCAVMSNEGSRGSFINFTDCHRTARFMCEKIGPGAYNEKAELEVSSSTDKFGVRDKLNISCKARTTSRGLKIMIDSPGISNSVISENYNKSLNNITVLSVTETRDIYRYDGTRCFRYVHLNVAIEADQGLDKSRITCVPQGADIATFIKSLAQSDKPKYLPRKPEAVLSGTPKRGLPSFGDRMTYRCTGRIGDKKVMTFVIARGFNTWARTINYDDKKASDIGDEPPWLKDLAFSMETYRHDDGHEFGGNFIKLTVRYNFIYEMREADFGCYSEDVSKKVRSKAPLSGSDRLSTWIDLARFSPRIHSKLKIDKISEAQIKGEKFVKKCDSVPIACTNLGGKTDSLQLILDNAGEVHSWTPSSNNLSKWLTIRSMFAHNNYVFGPSAKVLAQLNIRPDVMKASLICKATENSKIENDIMKVDLNMKFEAIANLPPVLIPHAHEDEEGGDVRLSLQCRSPVGEGDTQSWEIKDSKGATDKIFVNKDGTMSEATIPWITVEMLRAHGDSFCGQFITSQVKVLRKKPVGLGATIKCYSYDLRSELSVKSKHSLDELCAGYTIGAPFDASADLTLYMTWFIALFSVVLVITIAARCLRRNSKIPDNLAPGEMGEDEMSTMVSDSHRSRSLASKGVKSSARSATATSTATSNTGTRSAVSNH